MEMFSTFQQLPLYWKKYILYDGLRVLIKRIMFSKNL